MHLFLKSTITFFLLLSKKVNKTHISSFITSLSVTTMLFHSDVVVHCVRVMSSSLFILAAIFVVCVQYFWIFSPLMFDIEPKQCKLCIRDEVKST